MTDDFIDESFSLYSERKIRTINGTINRLQAELPIYFPLWNQKEREKENLEL